MHPVREAYEALELEMYTKYVLDAMYPKKGGC